MKTAAVVISYNPDRDFPRRIQQMTRECKTVYVIDNGSAPGSLKSVKAKIVRLGENTGIAHAQNVGLKLAFDKGADGVILFDHDSTPRKGFSAALWQAYRAEENPTIVGAQIYDINTQHFSKYPTYAGPVFRRRACGADAVLRGAMLAIASGTLISRAVYERVGGMEDTLFIDYVDWEYCLRARYRHGIATVICGAAVLEHARGERKARRFLGVTVRPPGYSLFRYRHMFRNRALLFRRYFFKAPAFIGFEFVATCRDFLLLFSEERPLQKVFAAVAAWFRGFLYTA
ncbi:MAG: glycosyltransferase family 2 protein [Turneriella sp.]|nr:glycosyltransferase family 2 protein [Turneriella sp.]